jgi:thioredoxin 1
MIAHLKNLAELRALFASAAGKLLVVDHAAAWCPPCRYIGPIFEALATKYVNVVFAKVDVDEAEDIAAWASTYTFVCCFVI